MYAPWRPYYNTSTTTNYPHYYPRVSVVADDEMRAEQYRREQAFVALFKKAPATEKPWHLEVRPMSCPFVVSRPEFHARSNPRS